MKPRLLLALSLFLAAAPQTRAAEADPRAEVAAALYHAHATQAAS